MKVIHRPVHDRFTRFLTLKNSSQICDAKRDSHWIRLVRLDWQLPHRDSLTRIDAVFTRPACQPGLRVFCLARRRRIAAKRRFK